MIETGTILQNRYRIEKQIGQGGMGKVYVATDERFNSTVAIKETVFEDKNLRKAFEREARLLNSLKHSALPRVSDHFDENDGQFLVMEYIAGEDLAEMMERNGEAFPLEKVLVWANQLCDALEYLHAQDIIHRDIKPQNLKLTPKGQIVLLDFGLAKGNPTDAQHQTAAKSIFGYSRSYASLEQIQGTGTEPRSDLYSLSATIYHLLTGIPPADALTRAMNVLNGKPDPLISANLVNKQVPRGVADVLQKALALNASERPESASAMREMLNECDKEITTDAAFAAAGNSLTADLLTQDTKIMAAATNAPNAGKGEVKTNVLSGESSKEKSYKTNVIGANNDSILTKVQSSSENTKSPRRARTVGASVFGGLLLVGSAVSAFYFYSPHDSRTNSTPEIIKSESTTNAFALQGNANIEITNTANENTIAESANTNAQPKESTAKPVETAKKNNKQTKNQTESAQGSGKSKKSEANSDEWIVRGETVETKDMIIDENGIRLKSPPVPAHPNVKVPPAGVRYLTPEEIQKLKELRKKPRVIVVETPKPKPTP